MENTCALLFAELGECYHLWTREDFEIIFTSREDYQAAMSLFAICAKYYSDIKVITFELMSNHIHFVASGKRERILMMFELFKKKLMPHCREWGRHLDWDAFEAKTRRIESLEDMRNVIIYNNRNGYVVHPEHSPFSYPWGANRFYFNQDATKAAATQSKTMSVYEKRCIFHSKAADKIQGLQLFEGCVSPTCFCDIATGEKLFRNTSHYFNKLSRSIEASQAIAKEIGESIFYTDDELFSLISRISKTQHGSTPSSLPPDIKIQMAKMMRFEYSASPKQIMRILKLSSGVLSSLGIS